MDCEVLIINTRTESVEERYVHASQRDLSDLRYMLDLCREDYREDRIIVTLNPSREAIDCSKWKRDEKGRWIDDNGNLTV